MIGTGPMSPPVVGCIDSCSPGIAISAEIQIPVVIVVNVIVVDGKLCAIRRELVRTKSNKLTIT